MALANLSLTNDDPRTGTLRFRSPGLALLVERLEESEYAEILDLGPPRNAILALRAHAPCRIHIEDVFRSLRDAPAEGRSDGESASRVAPLVCAPRPCIDIVLGWDLFDYLTAQDIRTLMTEVALRCRQHALLFVLAAGRGPIPAAPGRCTIEGDGGLLYASTGPATGDSPAWSPRALERMMPGFRLLHSFLLGHGMQDYLFVRGASAGDATSARR